MNESTEKTWLRLVEVQVTPRLSWFYLAARTEAPYLLSGALGPFRSPLEAGNWFEEHATIYQMDLNLIQTTSQAERKTLWTYRKHSVQVNIKLPLDEFTERIGNRRLEGPEGKALKEELEIKCLAMSGALEIRCVKKANMLCQRVSLPDEEPYLMLFANVDIEFDGPNLSAKEEQHLIESQVIPRATIAFLGIHDQKVAFWYDDIDY